MNEPLVSVIIPTYERAELLLTRSIPSVMAQTYQNWELRIVGDGATREVLAAMATLSDPRIHFENRPRQDYPEDKWAMWNCKGSQAINYGLDTALGEYTCTLGDDDELMPNFIESLLRAIQENDWDACYGRSEIVGHGFLGSWPPRLGAQTNDMLWLAGPLRHDPKCYLRGVPNDWDFLNRLMESGYLFGHIREVLYRYHPAFSIPGCDPV